MAKAMLFKLGVTTKNGLEFKSGSPKISSNICLVSVGTLPDSSSVDVDLNRVCGVGRLMVVENEDVATQGVDPCGEHCCILKEPDNRQDGHKVLM